MAQTQTLSPASTEEQQAFVVASVLRALADPTRLRVFVQLRQGETCVCELADTLHLAENLVSHHLGVLRRAGLVRDRRDANDARWVYYQLDATLLSQVAAELGTLFDPRTLGTRTPTCGPAALSAQPVLPRRVTQRSKHDPAGRS